MGLEQIRKNDYNIKIVEHFIKQIKPKNSILYKV